MRTKSDLEKENASLARKVAKLEAKIAELEEANANLQDQVGVDHGAVFGPNAVPLESR